MKVLFVTNIPSPYRVDFFNELGKHCELTVLFEKKASDERDSSWQNYHFDNFNGIFMNGKSISVDMAYCPEVIGYVRNKKWDAVICSNFLSPTGMKLTSFLRRHHIPYILESDGGFKSSDSFIKKILKTRAIKGADWYLSTSDSHDEYYAYYGADKEKIIRYPFSSIRNENILKKPLTTQEKSEIKKELGITEQFAVLAVGQFIHRKGFDILLKAAKDFPANTGVYFVGGKPTKEYIALKENSGLNNVHFVGFKKPDKLSRYYRAADIFVLPTRKDIWGLVINEAAAYALPVITTNRCLAGVQIIENGKNGFIVPVENAESISGAVRQLLADENLRGKISLANLEKAKQYTIETMTESHLRILQKY